MTKDTPLSVLANKAVKELNLADFLASHEPDIFEKLLDLDKSAMETGTTTKKVSTECDMLFIAEGIPVVGGLIAVGSKPQDFSKAVKWISTEVPDIDAVAGLSALTFMYLVNRGTDADKTDENKKEAWDRINKRIERLF